MLRLHSAAISYGSCISVHGDYDLTSTIQGSFFVARELRPSTFAFFLHLISAGRLEDKIRSKLSGFLCDAGKAVLSPQISILGLTAPFIKNMRLGPLILRLVYHVRNENKNCHNLALVHGKLVCRNGKRFGRDCQG